MIYEITLDNIDTIKNSFINYEYLKKKLLEKIIITE